MTNSEWRIANCEGSLIAVRDTMAKMDANEREPPLRSHTTLRTLFVATAVAALVSAVFMSLPYRVVTNLLIVPCAACFVSGLFGLSLWAALAIGFVTAIAADSYLIATFKKDGMPLGTAIKYALEEAFPATWLVGLSWITASWWGLYLRCAWSNPVWPPARECDSGITRRRATLQDRVIARCADSPMGFFIISLLANLLVIIVGVQFM
jgi:hypothetical protein